MGRRRYSLLRPHPTEMTLGEVPFSDNQPRYMDNDAEAPNSNIQTQQQLKHTHTNTHTHILYIFFTYTNIDVQSESLRHVAPCIIITSFGQPNN